MTFCWVEMSLCQAGEEKGGVGSSDGCVKMRWVICVFEKYMRCLRVVYAVCVFLWDV